MDRSYLRHIFLFFTIIFHKKTAIYQIFLLIYGCFGHNENRLFWAVIQNRPNHLLLRLFCWFPESEIIIPSMDIYHASVHISIGKNTVS